MRESKELGDDRRCAEIGFIYEEWMQSETRFQFPDRAKAMRQKAMEAYQRIGDETQREFKLANLERGFQLYAGPTPTETGADSSGANGTS